MYLLKVQFKIVWKVSATESWARQCTEIRLVANGINVFINSIESKLRHKNKLCNSYSSINLEIDIDSFKNCS